MLHLTTFPSRLPTKLSNRSVKGKMKLATTFLTSPCSIRSLGWAPHGRINGAYAPSFVSVRASVTDDKNKPVLKLGVLGKHSTGTRLMTSVVPTSNYMVPLDKHSTGTRPMTSMIDILHNLNKPRPMTTMVDILHNLSVDKRPACQTLNTYSPGWCGEVRDVKYSDNGRVTVVYRVTIHGSDGQAYREAIGTIALNDERYKDPEAEAEEKAFAKACARFGVLGSTSLQ